MGDGYQPSQLASSLRHFLAEHNDYLFLIYTLLLFSPRTSRGFCFFDAMYLPSFYDIYYMDCRRHGCWQLPMIFDFLAFSRSTQRQSLPLAAAARRITPSTAFLLLAFISFT